MYWSFRTKTDYDLHSSEECLFASGRSEANFTYLFLLIYKLHITVLYIAKSSMNVYQNMFRNLMRETFILHLPEVQIGYNMVQCVCHIYYTSYFIFQFGLYSQIYTQQ